MTDQDKTALLSKLRAEGVQASAPVADERAAFEAAMQMRGQNIYRWPNPHGGYRNSTTEMAWYAWSDRAALASVPACSEATDADLDKLYRETITEGPENDIRCWENPHRLYARAVLARYARAALASAPVAGEPTKPRPSMCRIAGVSEDVLRRAAERHFKPPFDNCSFRMCDLPGQCRGEGKCHHPAPQASEAVRPALAVWYGSMPESNGKKNWTAILYRKGEVVFDGPHITIDRSEYPDRVRYEADRVRHLIGEIDEEPRILDYDADKCEHPTQADKDGECKPCNGMGFIDGVGDRCQACNGDGGDCAKGAGKWPMLSELHLYALMFAYNEGYSKAYDGRVFPNPFSENGSQAAAWQLGTDDGTEARAAQHPRTDGGGRE